MELLFRFGIYSLVSFPNVSFPAGTMSPTPNVFIGLLYEQPGVLLPNPLKLSPLPHPHIILVNQIVFIIYFDGISVDSIPGFTTFLIGCQSYAIFLNCAFVEIGAWGVPGCGYFLLSESKNSKSASF
jgi:hypothetical protein